MSKKVTGLLLFGLLLSTVFSGFGGNVVLPIGGLSADNVFANSNESAAVRGVEISPDSLKMVIGPGETRKNKFTITNRGDTQHTFRVSASPYQVMGEDYTPVFEGAEFSTRTQIASWITFEKDSYTLDSGESAVVDFTINIPQNAVGGGQYAAIFVSTEPESSSTISNIGRVGLLLYATIEGDVTEHGKIVNHKINTLVFDRNIASTAGVQNTGNTHFTMQQTIYVKSFFGGKDIFTHAVGYEVLPDTTRLVKTEWENTPALGLYRVTSSVDAIYFNKPSEQLGLYTRTVLVIPLFLFILILITLVILVIIIVIKIIRFRKAKIIR